ncbi:hypothetical protein ABIC83_004207, partial [Roseateles asaccharophilus]
DFELLSHLSSSTFEKLFSKHSATLSIRPDLSTRLRQLALRLSTQCCDQRSPRL